VPALSGPATRPGCGDPGDYVRSFPEAVEYRGCLIRGLARKLGLNFVAACLSGAEHRPKWAEGRKIRNVSSLSLVGLAFFMLVMIGAFAVRSAAGFGAVLIAMPMLAFVLPISTAVSVTTALTAITSVHHLGRGWRRVAWRHFAIMAFYSAIGIGLGFYFIQMLDEHALRRSLGAFLILYSIYALATAKASSTVSARWRGPLAAGTGVAGGLLGTLFGAGVGPIYVVDFNGLRLEREIFG
jgi:Sulfite exporter TauE/SafE